ncbi:MAG: hypothetical protein A2286_01535 [Gammaproteobacteria bacterium RIFOXYA12_FULL_61_12]|nr:MAG: hypothetical protein A2514_10080 [Gammaproteobacteria bacterium RIFOXYD12_FULL_61_37]OGT91010.1 MAG: hypothetical protein A2286_01535 [Gammaproteobacteria bacterium RIFOXYA12_FULL_61_12]
MSESEEQLAYYQVLVSVEQAPNEMRQVFADLAESDLKQKLLRPYRQGTSLISGNEIVPVSQIRKIHVVRTARTDEVERAELHTKSVREIDQFNRDSDSVVLISAGSGYDPQDILEAGEDVTAKYISGHPGADSGPSALVRLISNPWLVTVAGGLVVAYLIWKFGWNK